MPIIHRMALSLRRAHEVTKLRTVLRRRDWQDKRPASGEPLTECVSMGVGIALGMEQGHGAGRGPQIVCLSRLWGDSEPIVSNRCAM